MNLRLIPGGAGKRIHTEADLWREAADYWQSQARLWERATGVQVDRAGKAEAARNRWLTLAVLLATIDMALTVLLVWRW